MSAFALLPHARRQHPILRSPDNKMETRMSLRVRRPLRRTPLRIVHFAVFAAMLVAVPSVAAQSAPKVTTADYDRAVRFLRPSLDPLVVGGNVIAHWLPDGRFWYRGEVYRGHEFIMVNPARKSRARAFDHAAIAAALSKATDSTYGETNLPFDSFDLSEDGRSIEFDAGKSHWSCTLAKAACAKLGARKEPERRMRFGGGNDDGGVTSPDGKKAAFIRDWNLWVRDVATGKEKQLTTDGEGPVSQIVRVDEKGRTIWYVALGREPGQDPYFRHLYRIGLDGKRVASLTPEVGDHTVQLSPDARYIVDTYSQPDVPPVTVLRDAKGKVLMQVEKADISRLLAMGWKPPIPVKMKGPDGKTDIYGQMFVPTNLDSTKKYPIINNPYPGPQSGSVGSRSFAAARGDRQALAELGFVVVTIDGMGTPNRSKSFHDYYYGKMGRDNTLPSQVGGMKQLAERYRFIDIDRVGIYGHSGGGFATADAMFRYPDFFDVGISESGNHDQRQYEDDWGERYQGLLVRNPDGSDNYDQEANQNLAKNLKGHLLLAHGAVDDNVPPYNTLLVVDALIKANKDFDLLIIPNARHGYGVDSDYMMRRRWDYFVRWLLGTEPPKEYDIGAATRVVGSR
jgi:dienelactone hydrolase